MKDAECEVNCGCHSALLIQRSTCTTHESNRVAGKSLTHGRQVTIAEGIARVSIGAVADRGVVDHDTQGVDTAGSGARVSALFPDAGLIARTIRIDRTFGAAVRRRSNVIGHTRARRVTTSVLARGKRTAGRWEARIRLRSWRCGHHWNEIEQWGGTVLLFSKHWWLTRFSCRGHGTVGLTGHVEALDERISDSAGRATAERAVGPGGAFGIDAAHAWARIDASLVDARATHRAFRANDAFGFASGWRSLIRG